MSILKPSPAHIKDFISLNPDLPPHLAIEGRGVSYQCINNLCLKYFGKDFPTLRAEERQRDLRSLGKARLHVGDLPTPFSSHLRPRYFEALDS